MMQTFGEQAQNWLLERTPRERVLLGAALACCVLWLAVTAVWQPLRQQRAGLHASIARYDAGVAALQNPAFLATDAQTPPGDSRPVPVILTESAAIFQLVIRRLEAEGTGARVVLEEATFEQIILWLDTLQRDHALRVRDLEMTRRPAPGMVSTTLALER